MVSANLCPICKGRTYVTCTRKTVRYRMCYECRQSYVTQEVHQVEIDRLFSMVDEALLLQQELRDAFPDLVTD